MTVCALCQVEPQAIFLREQVGGPVVGLCDRCWKAFLATGKL